MELLLILTYTAICVVIFKAFKIPLNKWTVPTAVLGGVVIIGALFMTMNYNHPYSESVRQYYATTPIMPEVKGKVIEVAVRVNEPIKEGEVMFRIDPEPFEDVVAGLEGELVAARKDFDRAEQLASTGSGSVRNVDQTRARVESLEASLGQARFNLEHTVITAPGDGFVTQLALRLGMMVVPLPISPGMTFVHKEERLFYGWFRQNSLLRLQEGNDAEVTFDGIPGVIFSGEVIDVVPAIPEGQIRVGADLIRFDQSQQPGRIAVTIRITDPALDDYELPVGMYGQAAILTEHFHHIGTLRRILLRMAAWMNYVFPLH